MERASLRKAYGKTLTELGEKYDNIIAMDADLSCSTQTKMFGQKFPNRFFNMGIAEQNMIGVASGLALSGKIVFVSTFAVFATGRVYDQIRQSVCYPKLNVKIVATHGGLTVGKDGASHQMLEDLALMSSLPNMRVIVPADALETESVIKNIVEMDGPVYVRLSRDTLPVITNGEFTLGKGRILKDGEDITIVSTGTMSYYALEAAENLKSEGISARVINMATIKPIDKDIIIKAAKETAGIITVEEHNIYNGLGSRVAEVVSENYPTLIKRIGVNDTFGESGEPSDLLIKYGLSTENIIKNVKELLTEVKK